jgi:hypothetical protein
LPTPRFGRLNIDITKGKDDHEQTEMDMDLSDDDGMDNKGSGDLDFSKKIK